MESTLALQLHELLKDCESREKTIEIREQAAAQKEIANRQAEEAVTAREVFIRVESEKLQAFRDVESCRIKNQNLYNEAIRKEEALRDERSNFEREVIARSGAIEKEKKELAGWRERLTAKEVELDKTEAALRDEKIRHHEKVLKELAIIEQKKMDLVR